MVSHDDLTRFIAPHRLQDVVDRYVRARRLLAALVVVEAERGDQDDTASAPPLAMATALETLEDCCQIVAPAVALAEGAVSRNELTLRTVAADPRTPRERRRLMDWIDGRRGPGVTPIDVLLDTLADELGCDLELARG